MYKENYRYGLMIVTRAPDGEELYQTIGRTQPEIKRRCRSDASAIFMNFDPEVLQTE